MNTNQLKHFRDVMLKLDFMFIYYIVTLILYFKIFHKHNLAIIRNIVFNIYNALCEFTFRPTVSKPI